jgi:1,2-dihydroxy-3-keto-5-methylthiopentene dioxygenase
MATLNIYKNNQLQKQIIDTDSISNELSKIGIKFEKWAIQEVLENKSGIEEIEEKFKDKIQTVLRENNFSSYDIVSINPDIKGIEDLKNKFIPEHTHDDNEVRFFIDGQGLFCINQDENIYQVLCEKGDYISVPANTKHWFDMGSKANFKCIRFFEDEAGWIAKYTGSDISRQYPLFDEFQHNN